MRVNKISNTESQFAIPSKLNHLQFSAYSHLSQSHTIYHPSVPERLSFSHLHKSLPHFKTQIAPKKIFSSTQPVSVVSITTAGHTVLILYNVTNYCM